MGSLFIALISFVAGLFILNGRTDKTYLWTDMPRQLIIPLRIVLPVVLISLSITICFYHTSVNVVLHSSLPFGFALLYTLKNKTLDNWWKNIVYAMITAFSIWLISREQRGKMGFILVLIPILTFSITIIHLFILTIQAFIHKQFKEIRYCIFSYLLIIIAYYALAGYRNYARNYTLEESQKANAILWHYKVSQLNEQLPDSLKIHVKDAFAEQDFSYQYENWFSYARTPKKNNQFYINIVLENHHQIHPIQRYTEFRSYNNVIRRKNNNIHHTDTLFIPYTYYLIKDGKIFPDTLILTKITPNYPNKLLEP